MADERVGLEIDLKSFRQQLREAVQDLNSFTQKFGATSKEAQEAAKRVAELRENMRKAKEVSDAFNPDRKFQALQATLGGLASGFEAFQGAMGLVGEQSENMEKQLVKVQSAMAFAQGLNQLMELRESFGIAATLLKGQVIGAFTALRSAIGLTGIGLLVLAIGALVANFDKVKKFIYDTFPALKGLFDNFDKIKQIAMGVGNAILKFVMAPLKAIIDVFKGDFKQAMADLKSGFDVVSNYKEGVDKEMADQKKEADRKALEQLIKSEENQRDVMAAEGKKTYELEKKILADKLKLAEEDKDKQEDLFQEQRVMEAHHRKELADDAEKERKKREEDEKKRAEEAKKKREEEFAAGKLLADDQHLVDSAHEKDQLISDSEQQRVKDLMAARVQEIAIEKAAAEAKARIDAEVAASKEKFHQDELTLIDAAAELAGNATAVGKGLAIASTTISTYDAAQKAYASQLSIPSPDAPLRAAIAAAAAIASGLLRVKSILAVKVPKASVMVSTPSLAQASTPLAPKPAISNVQASLDKNSINNLGNQAIRAYVTETDVTNSQNRMADIRRRALLGGTTH